MHSVENKGGSGSVVQSCRNKFSSVVMCVYSQYYVEV